MAARHRTLAHRRALAGTLAVAVIAACNAPAAQSPSVAVNEDSGPEAKAYAGHADARAALVEAPPLAQAPAGLEAPAPNAASARDIATAWLDAFRRRDVAALSAVTGYPFELRDTGTAGRPETREFRRTAAAPEQMPEVLASWLSDDVLDRTMKASQTGQVQELAQISYWAKRWGSEVPPDTRPSEAYVSTNDAAFTFLFLVEGGRVRAVWKTGFDASIEVDLATQWLDALRRKDIDGLQRLTSYPFELRDAEVEAHCGDRRASTPKQMPKTLDCLLDDPIFNSALGRIRSKLKAASSRDSESGYFKGWRRAEHADLWPVTLLIGGGSPTMGDGYEFDLTFLVAKEGVRAFWKSGAQTSGD
jgi:hypothetical protein